MFPSALAKQATMQECLETGHGSQVVLMFPPLYKRDESGSVEASCSRGCVGLQPLLLVQANLRRGTSARLALEQDAYQVQRCRTHAAEVVLREAEVQAADVEAGLLDTLVQERGRTAEHHVRQHAQTPEVRRQSHGLTQHQLWGGELWAAQQRVDVRGVGEMCSITEVRQFDQRLG